MLLTTRSCRQPAHNGTADLPGRCKACSCTHAEQHRASTRAAPAQNRPTAALPATNHPLGCACQPLPPSHNPRPTHTTQRNTQPVVFRVDYVVEAIGNKEFGSVFLQAPAGGGGGQENVALSAVRAGWAKVREAGSQQSPYIEELRKAQEAAQAAGAGLWSKDPEALKGAVRPAAPADFDALELLQRVGKSKPVAGVVEAVLNGSTLRVTLLTDLTPVTVHVSGVQCPSMGKRPPGAGATVGAAESGTPAVANGGGDAGAAPTVPAAAAAAAPAPSAAAPAPSTAAPSAPQPEPFAREAKWFSEQRALGREVRIVLDGVDKYHNLFGAVMHPDGDKVASLAEGLVQAGLAKVRA